MPKINPSLSIYFHPEAIDEASAAIHWYRDRSPSTSDAFLRELDRAFEKIVETPTLWPKHIGPTQRFLLKRFPFSIVYRKQAEEVHILAVAHGKRKPGYWKNRLV